jgi:signal transduction histidine kinase
MRERTEELGGKFSIEALPKRGTRVVAKIPLPAK